MKGGEPVKTKEKQNKITPSEENWTSPDCKNNSLCLEDCELQEPAEKLVDGGDF